jgi:aryl-alcohol dehydrogenase-like predicted oxidoreductase
MRSARLMFATSIGNPDPDDSVRVIHKALDAGINLIDTADGYGDSEEIVGKALKGRRDSVVLATKFSRAMGDDPNRQGTSRRWIMTAVEGSLRRLQTDHIDLYQVHRLDPTPTSRRRSRRCRTWSTAGRYAPSARRRLPPPTSSRPSGSPSAAAWSASAPSSRPTRSSTAASSLRCCRSRSATGWACLVWGPLGQGLLTGRVRKGQQSRRAPRSLSSAHLSDERRLDAVEQLIPLAQEAGLPMTHLAMAFAIAHPGVTSALLGPRTMEQLDDLLAGMDVTLTDEILDRIDEIVPPGTDIGTLVGQAYLPPALQRSDLRRRPVEERAAV